MGLTHTLQERVFRQIHGNTLVYNTCWEDPRCDRELMDFRADSKILMLTSAGCNALDYLLDNPAEIHCVDLNPRQNALLEFKKALIDGSDHATLFDFFGNGATTQFKQVFKNVVAPRLPEASYRQYWHRHQDYFDGKGLRRSFYWRGSSGAVAWLVNKWMRSQPEVFRLASQLFESRNLEEQQARYSQFEPHILNRFVRWMLSRHVVQSMLGVPKAQQHLAAEYFPDGMSGYLRHCLRHVFTTLPLTDNYFWKLYFYGKYTADCCPNYLKAEHFDTLKGRVARVKTHTMSLSDFLLAYPGQYSHFILLDHQDWLAAKLRPALEEEWRLILENAAPGARVLLRSASFEIDFIPDFVKERVRFDREKAKAVQAKDRVGTYASTWIGFVEK